MRASPPKRTRWYSPDDAPLGVEPSDDWLQNEEAALGNMPSAWEERLAEVEAEEKLPPPTEKELRCHGENLFSDSPFESYVSSIRRDRQEAVSAFRARTEMAEAYRTGGPGIELRVERDYGAGTTVAEAIEVWEKKAEEARASLNQLEDAAFHHEDDLCRVLDAEGNSDQGYYPEALSRYVDRWGADKTHVNWLIYRASTEVEMDSQSRSKERFDRGEWGRDGRWRRGDRAVTLYVDPCRPPADYTFIGRRRIFSGNEESRMREVTEDNLRAAIKAAAILNYHALASNESPRSYWQFWLDRQLSALSQVSGIDFEVIVTGDNNKVPERDTVRRWELEINARDSEDQAQLRHWEAVSIYWYVDNSGSDSEDLEWAACVEKEADEARAWALNKRSGVERRRPPPECGGTS